MKLLLLYGSCQDVVYIATAVDNHDIEYGLYKVNAQISPTKSSSTKPLIACQRAVQPYPLY